MSNNEIACAHADILSKYKDLFPELFVESVRQGVSWLCTHNNITYQTSIMIASDKVVYNTPNSSILRIGLIDTARPLSGLTYYEVVSVEETTDDVSGALVFTIKMKYTTPMGLTVTLIPIKYFNPKETPDYFTKDEVNKMLESIKNDIKVNSVELIDTNKKIDAVSDRVKVIEDTFSDIALPDMTMYVAKTQYDFDLAELENKIDSSDNAILADDLRDIQEGMMVLKADVTEMKPKVENKQDKLFDYAQVDRPTAFSKDQTWFNIETDELYKALAPDNTKPDVLDWVKQGDLVNASIHKELKDTLATKADSSKVYTKDEADAKFATK